MTETERSIIDRLKLLDDRIDLLTQMVKAEHEYWREKFQPTLTQLTLPNEVINWNPMDGYVGPEITIVDDNRIAGIE